MKKNSSLIIMKINLNVIFSKISLKCLHKIIYSRHYYDKLLKKASIVIAHHIFLGKLVLKGTINKKNFLFKPTTIKKF